MRFIFKIKPFKDVYLFVNNKLPSRSKRSADKHTDKLKNHESVGVSYQLNLYLFNLILN